MPSKFARIATVASNIAGAPATFVLVVTMMIVWAIAGPFAHFSDTWQLVANTITTLLTTLLVLLVQNTQNRLDAAVHAKLDELIRVHDQAHNELIGIEKHIEQETPSWTNEPGA